MPPISVIVPAYNAAGVLDRCLGSLAEQTLDPALYETIVVDDGSQDDTAAIAREWNITLISQKNAGPAAARNRGATAASGSILVFTDADCELAPTFLERLTKPFEHNEVVAAQGRYETRQRECTAVFCQVEIEERYELYAQCDSITMIGTYAAAYRRDIFDRVGGFDPRFPIASGEDFELSKKVAGLGHQMVFVSDAVCYHQHPHTLHDYFKQKFQRGYWRNLLYAIHPSAMLADHYTPQMLKLQIVISLMSPFWLAFGLFMAFRVGVEESAPWFGAWLTVFLLSCLPLMRIARARSISLPWIVPGFVAVRSVALASGLAAGWLGLHLRLGRAAKTLEPGSPA